jgi:hypothetical protein
VILLPDNSTWCLHCEAMVSETPRSRAELRERCEGVMAQDVPSRDIGHLEICPEMLGPYSTNSIPG